MGSHGPGVMQVVRDAGGFTVDAALLARIFGWSAEELRGHMRRGLVTSRVERGDGSDRGRWRLTVQCGNRRWQAIVGPDGKVLDQDMDFLAPRRPADDPACKPRQDEAEDPHRN